MPILPKLSSFRQKLEIIWKSRQLTNNGQFVLNLEKILSEILDVSNVISFCNGTIALLCLLKVRNYRPGSEVIVTPFTFAATATAIEWAGLTPVFADVLEDDLTLNPKVVEQLINNKTVAVLPVHVYGHICKVEEFKKIGNKYNIDIIYDAAHAFDSKLKGRGIANFGEASMFSLHATKLFHSIEGGIIATNDDELSNQLKLIRNFGILNEDTVSISGINGKMNELQAAFALSTIKEYEIEKYKRKRLRHDYDKIFMPLKGIKVFKTPTSVENSEQYYPIVINEYKFGKSRDMIYETLKTHNIFARKYFYPICTDFTQFKNYKVNALSSRKIIEELKNQVLCLPFHSGVKKNDLIRIKNIFEGA